MEIKGRDLVAGVPKTLIINTDEIREALAEPVNAIVDAVRSVLERTPPELAADIVDTGIVLTGGGAQLQEPRRAAARGDRPAGDGLPIARVRGRARHRPGPRRARPAPGSRAAVVVDGRGRAASACAKLAVVAATLLVGAHRAAHERPEPGRAVGARPRHPAPGLARRRRRCRTSRARSPASRAATSS